MDLSKLSDEDFSKLRAGKLSEMSDAGFTELLRQQAAAQNPKERRALLTAGEESRAMEQYNPTNGVPAAENFAAGAGKAIADIGRGIGQRVGSVSQAEVDDAAKNDAPLMASGAGRAGYFAGMMAPATASAMAPGGQTVSGSLLYGGLLGAAQPTAEGENPWGNAALSGGFSAIGTGGANLLAKAIAPNIPAASSRLYSSGVRLTPGQALGGAWDRAEQGMTSIPFVGDVIKNNRRAAIADWNSSIANDALSHIGKSIPKGTAGNEAVEQTGKLIGDAYEAALAKIPTVMPDSQFATEIATLVQGVRRSAMPKDVQSQFETVIKAQLGGKFQGTARAQGSPLGGSMTPQTFKDAESELGRLARDYMASTNPDQRHLGEALLEAQASLRGLLERTAPAGVADEIKAANAAWAKFKRIEGANSFLGAQKEEVFSPENFLNAVKSLEKNKGRFARGQALGQDQALDAYRVLGSKVPDSGTPFRTAVQNPISALTAGGLSSPVLLAYTGAGKVPTDNLLRALIAAPRSNAAKITAKELESLAPLFGAGLAAEYAASK